MLNKDHLPLLKYTRSLIDSGEFIFICNAISTAAQRIGMSWTAAVEAVEAIHEDLAGVEYRSSPTLELWLAAQLGVHWNRLNPNTLRMARLAWLDRLIDQLENDYAAANI